MTLKYVILIFSFLSFLAGIESESVYPLLFCVAQEVLISYLEYSGSLASSWSPEETLENLKTNLIGCPVMVCIVLPQNPAVIKFQFPRVSPGNQLLAKEPEDSGYEIGEVLLCHNMVKVVVDLGLNNTMSNEAILHCSS